MDDLILNVRCLHNSTYRKIMFRLIDVYQDECGCNEGSLQFNDLVTFYNLFYFLQEEEEQC